MERVDDFLKPSFRFISCGTWSQPCFCPVGDFWVGVVNSDQPYIGGYDVFYNQYSLCAMTAGMAHALNDHSWDLLVILDTDCLIGAVNFNSLLRGFMERKEVMLTPQWHGAPGGPFYAFKREGAAKFLHERKRANIVKPTEPKPMLPEHEMQAIYEGVWWNPWPNIETMRQDHPYRQVDNPRECLDWPFVRFPHPEIIEEYTRTQTSKAVPYDHS